MKYRIPVTYTFEGYFDIEADSKAQAEASASNDCGMTTSNGIHSNLSDEDIDWEFPVHPEEKIGSAKKIIIIAEVKPTK